MVWPGWPQIGHGGLLKVTISRRIEKCGSCIASVSMIKSASCTTQSAPSKRQISLSVSLFVILRWKWYQSVDDVPQVRVVVRQRPLAADELHELVLSLSRHAGVREDYFDVPPARIVLHPLCDVQSSQFSMFFTINEVNIEQLRHMYEFASHETTRIKKVTEMCVFKQNRSMWRFFFFFFFFGRYARWSETFCMKAVPGVMQFESKRGLSLLGGAASPSSFRISSSRCSFSLWLVGISAHYAISVCYELH